MHYIQATFLFAPFALATLTGCKARPTALDYCKRLEQMDVARNCAAAEPPGAGRTRAEFAWVSTGARGYVVSGGTREEYVENVNFWRKSKEEGRINEFWPSGEESRVIVNMTGEIDGAERRAMSKFSDDVDMLATGKPASAPVRVEHPTPSTACDEGNKCSRDGLCRVVPSAPTKCIAAMDADCRKSGVCLTEKRCIADEAEGVCRKGSR